MNIVPRRDAGDSRAKAPKVGLVNRCARAVGGSQALEEAVGEHQTSLAGCLGYRAACGGELLARPAPKIALIGLHSPPPRTSTLPRVANRNLLKLIHRSSPVRGRNQSSA